jgi:O-antigen/teichoic acid export membrane protein
VSQNRKNATNFFIYNFPIWVPSVISFALLPVYTAYLTPKDYGIRAVILLAILILQLCTNLGTNWIIRAKYYSYDLGTQRNSFISTLVLITFILKSAFSIFFFFIAPYIFPLIFTDWNGIFNSLFKIQLLIFLFDFCKPVFTQVLIMDGLAKTYSLLTLSSYFCNLSVSLYLLVVKNNGIFSLFYGELTGSILFLSLSFLILRHKIVFQFQKEAISDIIKIGLPAVPKSLFAQIQENIDRYFLQLFLPVAGLGLYSKSQFLKQGFDNTYKAFSNAFSPSYLKSMSENGKDTEGKKIMACWLFLISGMLLFLILFMPDIFRIMGVNKNFWICAKYAPLLSFQIVINSYGMLYSNNILISRKTYLFTVRSIVAGITNIVLNLLLIPRIGVPGAILSSLISHSLIIVLGYYFSEGVLSFKTELNLSVYLQYLNLFTLIILIQCMQKSQS